MLQLPLGSHAVRALLSAACGASIIVSALTGAQATGTALVRHAPSINGVLDGSVQQMLGESAALNTGARISADWMVVGTPTVVLNGSVSYGGTINGTGSSTPTNYWITLNSGSTLGRLVRRTNAVALPTLTAPPTPTGTRSVSITTAGQSVGDWATLRNLTLNSNVGNYTVPAGAYGTFISNGGGSFTLGTAGATQPSTYSFQGLMLNGNAQLRVVGPVVVKVAGSVTINTGGYAGASTNPSWLTLQLPSGGLNLNSSANVYGFVTAPNGTVIVNSNCQLIGGLTSDRLTINSGGLLRLQAFQAPNQAPTANPQSVQTNEDGAKVITLTGSDPENATLTFTVVTPPANGTLSTADGPLTTFPHSNLSTGNLTYTPNANWSGSDSFTFKVSDGSLESTLATVSITVQPVNDAPEADAKSVTVAEDSPVSILLSGLDVEDSSLTFAITTTPAHGTLSASGGSPITYTPAPNYHGPDAFTYVANDGALSSVPATVSITVDPVNDVPSATSREVTTDEETDVATPLAGDDIDGDALTFEVLTGPAHGELLGTAPALSYRPAVDFAQTDTFTFRAFDGQAWSAPATFAVHVNNINDIPSAAGRVLALDEDVTTEFVVTGSDPDGDALTFAILTAPEHGTLLANGVALTTFPHEGLLTGNLTYEPADDFHGADTFTFRTRDGMADSAAATVVISVNPINDAPIGNQQSVTTAEDTTAEVTLTGNDVEGDALTFDVTVQPLHGVLTLVSAGADHASYLFEPAANESGTDSFTFIARDGALASAPVIVPITITPVNDAPEGTPDGDETDEDVAVEITLAGTDVDGDALSYAIVSGPAQGTLSTADGPLTAFPHSDLSTPHLTYTPAVDFHGTDSMTFTVGDGELNSAPVSFTLTVHPINDAPETVPLEFNATHDRAVDVTLSAIDVDGDALTYAVGTPQHGALAPRGATGEPGFTYTPAPGFVGDDVFAFSVDDGTSGPVSGTATIHVINQVPVAAGATLLAVEDLSSSIMLTATDADSDTLTYLLGQPQHGQLTGTAPNLVYTPGPDFNGSDSFTFRVSDGLSESTEAAIAITVQPVTDVPVATLDVTTPNGVVSTNDTLTLTANAISVDGPIARVEFYDGDVLIGEVANGPFELSWRPSTAGVHSFWVRAYGPGGEFADSPRRDITVLAALPYLTDFEAGEGYVPGDIDGQLGWTATGNATIAVGDASSGTQALALVGGLAIPEATQLIAPNGQGERVFIDFFARPVAGPAPAGAVSFDGETAILAAVITEDALAELYVWNGDGAAGGTWMATGFTFPIDGARAALAWLRITVRKDYAAREWDVFVNGRMVEGALRFRNYDVDRVGRLMFVGPIAGAARVDDIYAGPDNPLFTDADRDGIDDAYEVLNGMNPAADDRNGDVDGEGLLNLREFILGTRANLTDSDGDGLPDNWEVTYGLDPTSAAGSADTDGDGLADVQEFGRGTSPIDADSDDDGMPDGWEVTYGLLPLDPADATGDPDQDLLTNLREYRTGRDPGLFEADAVVLADATLALWLRGDRGLPGDGMAVTTWQDQSGTGNHATTAGPEGAPAVVADQANGIPVVRFDGGDDRLEVDLDGLGSGDFTLIAVSARRSSKAPGFVLGAGDASTGVAYGYLSDTQWALQSGGSTLATNVAAFTAPIFAVDTAVWDGTSGRFLWHNGSSVASDQVTVPPSATAPAYVGSDGNSGGFAGDLAEVIVYRGRLTPVLQDAVEEYLIEKYDISIGGPPTPGDADGDGLLDTWEMQWFGNLNQNAGGDPDEDGATNLAEMTQGTDPTDFFNGEQPGIILVSGNDQSGVPGEFLLQPLTVQVVRAGGEPVAQAPVTFARVSGVGGSAALFGSPVSPSLLIRTNSEGVAKVFYKLEASDTTADSVIEASVGAPPRRAAVRFSAHLPQWFPDTNHLVVELNAGESTTRPINLLNATENPVHFQVDVADGETIVGDYVVRKSTDTGGPVYVWDDIRSRAVRLQPFSTDFNGYVEAELGFDFPFYGRTFRRLFISEDGFISFDRGLELWGPGDYLPSTYNPGNIIAPFWADMESYTAGDIYIVDEGDRAIIQWDGLNIDYWDHLKVTFQAILHRTGEIQFIYKSLEDGIDDAVIGIQNGDGSRGVQIQAWEEIVTSELAIAISPTVQWFSVDRAEGTLAPQANHTVVAQFDATHLPGGTYEGSAMLGSDYPGRNAIPISATFVVNALPVAEIITPARTRRVLVGQPVAIAGQASDREGPVVRVELFDGPNQVAEWTHAPYELSWSAAGIGEHVFTLRATDLKGAVAVSAPISVFVDSDSDADAIGDEWELGQRGVLTYFGAGDVDNDGVSDLDEYRHGFRPYWNDQDDDGLSDTQELQWGFDPFVADAAADTDDDGYSDAFEVVNGSDRASSASVPAPTYVVDPSGNGTHTTIKAALTAATRGFEVILVAPGIYQGANNTGLNLKNVMLISTHGAALTRIDGQGTNPGVGLDSSAVLRGFTIENCNGSGVAISADTPARIENCVITNCVSTDGAGIYVQGNGEVRSSTIVGNHLVPTETYARGSGIHLDYGLLRLTNSICWNEAASEISFEYGILLAEHSNVRGAFAGTGNQQVEPQLTGDLHLGSASPLRGAGPVLAVAESDMDGETRPAGQTTDIGADHYVDVDADGLADAWEQRYFGSLAADAPGDADADGASNLDEYLAATPPDEGTDGDADGIPDAIEIGTLQSNPLSADTDGDGLSDGYEFAHGLNPLLVDRLADRDGDGYPNEYEFRAGTDPQDPASVPVADFTVDPTGGGTHTTIQAAVNATTRNHQIIRVRPGVYNEFVGLSRWRTLLISTEGASRTIIDGGRVRQCLSVSSESVIVGFQLRNGGTDRMYGGGIAIGENFWGNPNRMVVLDRCVVANNRASEGGGLYCDADEPIEVVIRHCTFLGNSAAGNGAAITAYSYTHQTVHISVIDSILWDGHPSEIRNEGSQVTVTNSIVRGGYAGVGVLNVDPLLTTDGHLQALSPARGRATVGAGFDMDREPVTADGAPDLGADEFIDTDEDLLADAWELRYFGSLTAQGASDDFDGDGAVNGAEYVNGTTPLQDPDSDADGLTDSAEITLHGTNPTVPDSERDGVPDGVEVQNSLDPLRDDAFDDLDGDGYPNAFEAMRGANPLLASSIPAADYTVAMTTPRTHSTVRAALTTASGSGQDYRIILVAPGTYSVGTTLRASFRNQRILLISSGGAAQTILDGGSVEGGGSGLFFDVPGAIHGFTIRGVYSSSDGGAFLMYANATISNCVIRNNRARHGGVAGVAAGRSRFIHSTMINNTALDSGSGFATSPDATIELSNSIVWNPDATGEIRGYGRIISRNSIVRDGDGFGGGIDVNPLTAADGHLRMASPARSAGLAGALPLQDMDGESRPVQGTPDLGADQFSVLVSGDADEDGMLDTWETGHGLDPLAADGYEDPDGDGFANVHEASHNTDPYNAADVPVPDIIVDGSPGAANPSLKIFATVPEACAALTQPYQIIGIRPGTYAAGISVAGQNARGVLVMSTDGAVRTTIDGGSTSFGFSLAAETTLSGLTIANCFSDSGAALSIDATRVRVLNCVLRDNHATSLGGAILSANGDVDLVHATLLWNRIDGHSDGGAVVALGGTIRIANSIVWGRSLGADLKADAAATMTVASSVVRPGSLYGDGGGNLLLDPLVSPRTGHLAGNSPAINVGSADVAVPYDLDRDGRPSGAGPDLGADEFVDADADGLNDGWEQSTFGDLSSGADDDPDGDGLSNRDEFLHASDPQVADTDGDGLDDRIEVVTHGTGPLITDTDEDGTSDAAEVAAGLDPLRDDVYLDSDDDALTNLKELSVGTHPQNEDTDGDGLLDGLEAAQGFDPLVADYVRPDRIPPAVPTGGRIDGVTPHTVTLSWDPVVDAGGAVTYEVWRDSLLIERTSAVSYTDDYGFEGIYPFTYEIRAVDTAGNLSDASEAVSGSTAAGFGPAPNDADGDGMLDANDPEPNDPANAFRDDDGDAIQNRDDARPDVHDGAPPAVKILNNDDRVNYLKGETMRLTVRVTDPNAVVEILRNQARLGSATRETNEVFVYEWRDLPEGIHHVSAVVKSAAGALVATRRFLVDVAEVEAHITLVGPHSDREFGKDYSIRSRLDGRTVVRPILQNRYSPPWVPVDLTQPIDVHYERFYRGDHRVEVYRGDTEVTSFELPAGQKYPLVVLREVGGNVVPYVIDPPVPAPGQAMIKVANFSSSPILGGFTNYFFFGGTGGTDANSAAQRTQALLEGVSSAMNPAMRVEPSRIVDAPGGGSNVAFYAEGDYAWSFRAHPEPPNEYPGDLEWYSPEWWSWYRTYGKMVYSFVAFPAHASERSLYCYYQHSDSDRGLQWRGSVPILPEIRLTPFNVGSVDYPGGRGHPANNQTAFSVPLLVNNDVDGNGLLADNADGALHPADDDIVHLNIKIDARNRTDVKKIHVHLPTDGTGNPVLRGFYKSSATLSALPGSDFVWDLAQYPTLLSAEGMTLYFEGLRARTNARLEIDVLNDDNVPVNRVYPTAGVPETVRFDVINARVAVDGNRDGAIQLDPSDAVSSSHPYYLRVNGDFDSGGPARDAMDGAVNGLEDLGDFMPVYLDLKELMAALPPDASVKYKLMHGDNALNFVYTNLTRASAMSYRTADLLTGFGPSLDRPARSAGTVAVSAGGVDLFDPATGGSEAFKDAITSGDGGVLLLEAKTASDQPLILSVQKDGNTVWEYRLSLKLFEAHLTLDANRDRAISLDASDATTRARPYHFAINNGFDSGGLPRDFADGAVNGPMDLADFVPVHIELGQLLAALPPGPDTQYLFKHADGAVNFVYTNLTRQSAFSYLSTSAMSGFGPALDQPALSAPVHQITPAGFDLFASAGGSEAFRQVVSGTGAGIVLIEGRAISDQPLVLAVRQGGRPVAELELAVNLIKLDAGIDGDGDGVISLSGADATHADQPFALGINGDRDSGATTDTDASDLVVNGAQDLKDFSPVFLDLKELVDLLPPGAATKYLLKQQDEALNLVFTGLTRGTAFSFRTDSAANYGPGLNQTAGSAATRRITAGGLNLFDPASGGSAPFLDAIRNGDGGVVLLEAISSSDKPLLLVIEEAGVVLAEFEVHLASLALQSVEWVAKDSAVTADNPNAGGGDRIFPDKRDPADTIDRAKVVIRAHLVQPQANVRVYFKVIDVDDPSSNTIPLDDEAAPADNKGGNFTAPAAYAITNASGVAELEFTVTKQPGDNFRALASLSGVTAFDHLMAKQNDGVDARIQDAGGNVISPYESLAISDMLTVWRKLYVEVDSMGVVANNTLTGNVTGLFNLNPALVTPANQYDLVVETDQNLTSDSNGRFQGGTFSQGADTWPVAASTTGSGILVQIHRSSASDPIPSQSSFTSLVDDDLTGDVPEPDTSHLALAFAPAYVEPDFAYAQGMGFNGTSVPFVLHINGPSDVDAQISANRGSPEISNDFWSIYILGGFQPAASVDHDPNGESYRNGDTASVSSPTRPRYYARGSIIYMETLRDSGTNGGWVTAHEVGHYFNGNGTDSADPGHNLGNSLMAPGLRMTSGAFDDDSLNRIRAWRR